MTKPGSDMWRGCLDRRNVVEFRRALRLPAVVIEDEKRLFVNCGKCANCLADRQKDWVGRTIGEAYGADHSYFVTLTIGGDSYISSKELGVNWRATWFHPEDVRAYIKRLRIFQYRDWRSDMKEAGLDWKLHVPPALRFFLVGENGSEKGRVHYHMLAFTYGAECPKGIREGADGRSRLGVDVFHGKMDESVTLGAYENIEVERTYWPFGWSNWQEGKPQHSWYTANYVNKGALIGRDKASIMRPGISTKPLMGARYFDLLAGDYVKQGLSPQERTYLTPGNPYYHGTMPKYWLSDAACRRFYLSFVAKWRAEYGHGKWPYSEFLEQCEDRESRKNYGPVRDDLLNARWKLVAEKRTMPRGFFNPYASEFQLNPPMKWAELDEAEKGAIMSRIEVARALERGEPVEGL